MHLLSNDVLQDCDRRAYRNQEPVSPVKSLIKGKPVTNLVSYFLFSYPYAVFFLLYFIIYGKGEVDGGEWILVPEVLILSLIGNIMDLYMSLHRDCYRNIRHSEEDYEPTLR